MEPASSPPRPSPAGNPFTVLTINKIPDDIDTTGLGKNYPGVEASPRDPYKDHSSLQSAVIKKWRERSQTRERKEKKVLRPNRQDQEDLSRGDNRIT